MPALAPAPRGVDHRVAAIEADVARLDAAAVHLHHGAARHDHEPRMRGRADGLAALGAAGAALLVGGGHEAVMRGHGLNRLASGPRSSRSRLSPEQDGIQAR